MSPFMSSMPAAGLIEMPPVSKQTPLPTKATGWRFSPCAPRQRMTTSRLSRVEPWPTPSSAPMPSLAIAFSSSISTSTPSFFELLGAFGECIRKQHVGRLVDEVAGELDALGDRRPRRGGGARRRRRRRSRSSRWRRRRRPPRSFFLRLVFVESIGAQPHAEREFGRRRASQSPLGRVEGDRRPSWPRRACRRRSRRGWRNRFGLPSLPGATPTTSSAVASRPAGCDNIERARGLPAKSDRLGGGLGSARPRSPSSCATRRRRLEVGADEDDVSCRPWAPDSEPKAILTNSLISILAWRRHALGRARARQSRLIEGLSPPTSIRRQKAAGGTTRRSRRVAPCQSDGSVSASAAAAERPRGAASIVAYGTVRSDVADRTICLPHRGDGLSGRARRV